MPATNPRITITVQPSVDVVLSRLSDLTGQSKSSLIAEVLETSMPVFERMATVIEAAKQAKDSLKAKTMKDMEAAEAKLHDILGMTMDIFDETTLPIVEEAERIKRRTRTTPSPAQMAAKYGTTGVPVAEEQKQITGAEMALKYGVSDVPAIAKSPRISAAAIAAAHGTTEAPAIRTDGRMRASAPPARPKSPARPPHVTRGSGTPNNEKITTKSESKAISGRASKSLKTASEPSKRKGRG